MKDILKRDRTKPFYIGDQIMYTKNVKPIAYCYICQLKVGTCSHTSDKKKGKI